MKALGLEIIDEEQAVLTVRMLARFDSAMNPPGEASAVSVFFLKMEDC